MSNQSLEGIHNYLRLSERIGTSGQPKREQFTAIREAGFELVINLLPEKQTLEQEEALVRSLGMDYVQIPVWWDAPEIDDIERFFVVMEDNSERKLFVHCAANMRVSAFMYLYNVVQAGTPEAEAVRNLNRIWTPNPIWDGFIKRVTAHYHDAGGAE